MKIRFEFRRLFTGRTLWIALVPGLLIALSQILVENISYAINPLITFQGQNSCPVTLYKAWIGGHLNVFKSTYIYIMPITASYAHALSYHSDIKKGYIKNVIINMSMKNYLIAKYIVSFVAGGIVSALPMIINFMINAAFLPAINPWMGTNYTRADSLFAVMAHKNPMEHFLISMLIYFLFGGAFAVLTLAATRYIENGFLLSLFPFAVMYILAYVVNNFFMGNSVTGQISPMVILNIVHNQTKLIAVVVELMILIGGSWLVYYYGGHKKDVI